jgi:uncharacterized protein with PIN domain
VRIACDAMFGGVARWLRMFGADTAFTPGIADAAIVSAALKESRIVVSSDRRLFERRAFTSGKLRGLFVPVGMPLDEQIRFVVNALALQPGFPRCTRCNGELVPVRRDEVADVVPARTLAWMREYHRCIECGGVFWEGTHWRRIADMRSLLASEHARPTAQCAPA